MRKARFLVCLVGILVLAYPSGVGAVTRNTPVTHKQQPNDRTCVATSSYMQAKRINANVSLPPIDVVDESSIDPNTMHGYGSSHKYCYPNSEPYWAPWRLG